MTNGEKFKQIFEISQVDDCDLSVYAWLPIHDAIEIPLEWWNAEYQEPTSKNNLAHNLCDSCTNIRCEFQSGIVRTKCAFYMPPQHLSGLEKNSKKLEKDFGESDCISRADVIKILGKIEQMVWDGEGFDYEESRAMIDELPSVTPIRLKGHWIDRWDKVLLCEDKNCSICGYLAQTKYNYCPKCGADMREVEE